MITLTEIAASEVKRLMAGNSAPDAVLRVGVQGGGCSGCSYELDLDEKAGEGDRVFEQHGITVVCEITPRRSCGYVSTSDGAATTWKSSRSSTMPRVCSPIGGQSSKTSN